jgi:SpoIVB peptidase S55
MLEPDALVPGQKAEVRTVFTGQKIETFEAEILGVLKGGKAEGDMILARATSERVVRSGVAQGMSGSPVYVDGKLIGALSSGWTFSNEPIFGITPIHEMLRVLDLHDLGNDRDGAGPVGVEGGVLSAPARYREFRWPGDEREGSAADAARTSGATSSEPGNGLAPLAVPIACAGLHSAALAMAKELLAPLGFSAVPGGTAQGGGPTAEAMQPGSAVAVDLMTGDLQISAIGTVTWREADRVLIFGHPFFQAGEIRMPLSSAEITTIVPSAASSFKLGVRGREVGVATQDRRAAVGGRIGGHVSMLPVTVEVAGGGRDAQRFHFEALEDRALAPTFIPLAALNSLFETGGNGAGQTLRWTVELYRAGAAPLVLHDLSTGEGASNELLSGLTAPLRYLFNNPYRRLHLDSLRVKIDVVTERQQWTLRSARLEAAAVRPGARLMVRCDLERWRGGHETREIAVNVPEEVPPGRYMLWIGGGNELTHLEAQRMPARFRPASLDEAWGRLANARGDDALYGVLVAHAPEVTSDGRDYPELPASALLVLSSGLSGGDRAHRSDTALLDESRLPLGALVVGEQQIELIVDDRAP